MILNLNPIFLPSLVFFKRENIINISYDFLSPINNNKNDLSIKNILKNVTFSENKSFYFLKTNKFMVESVINIKKNNNNYIWIINEFHIKINVFQHWIKGPQVGVQQSNLKEICKTKQNDEMFDEIVRK